LLSAPSSVSKSPKAIAARGQLPALKEIAPGLAVWSMIPQRKT
jgi:hypothetical protein